MSGQWREPDGGPVDLIRSTIDPDVWSPLATDADAAAVGEHAGGLRKVQRWAVAEYVTEGQRHRWVPSAEGASLGLQVQDGVDQ